MLFLPVLIFLPGISDFIFPGSGAEFSDMAITHYPNALYLKQQLMQGKIPLWNPQIMAGAPFLAHPYSGMWYPPYWLAILFPLPLGLNLFALLHIILGALGMTRLLNLSGVSERAALMAGVLFGLSPKLFAHLGAGHMMLVAAFCLSPWIFVASIENQRVGGRRFFQPAVLLAAIFFLDPRWAFYTGALWATWSIAHSHRGAIPARVAEILKQAVLAILITLPALILFSEFSGLSTRAALTAKESLVYSLPISAVADLFLPNWAGFHEWVLYWGMIPLLIVISVMLAKRRGEGSKFWIVILLVSLLISAGENIPVTEILAELPLLVQLRVPPRALFICAFAVAMLVGLNWDVFFNIQNRRAWRSKALLAFSLAAGIGAIAILLVKTGNNRGIAAGVAAFILSSFWISIQLMLRGKISAKTFQHITMGLIILDLGMMGHSLIRFVPAEIVVAEDKVLAMESLAQPLDGRIYSPSNSLAQQTSATYRLELANGIDPIQLTSSVNYLSEAVGIANNGYSVTFPPFNSANLASEYQRAVIDAESLANLNVAYILAAFEMENPSLSLIGQYDGEFLYRNIQDKGRAWLIGENDVVTAVSPQETGPNQWIMDVKGPGRLVLAEIAYPGWVAYVDGEDLPIDLYDGLVRSIQVNEGQHEVRFAFHPTGLAFSLPISLLTLIGLTIYSRKTSKET